MNYPELSRKRDLYQSGRASIPELTLQSYEQAFEIEYTHNSTAIEGNTLTLMETKVLLEDGITIGGKRLREIYETVNHQKAYRYVKECIAKEQPLDEKIIKDIHALLMENIFVGGIYRNVDVYISGAQHTPPSPGEMYRQVKDFYADLTWKGKEMNPIELAAWTHAEFVRIHPFPDGNGRTSRPDYELSAFSKRISCRVYRKREPTGLFQCLGSLCGRGQSGPVCRNGCRPDRPAAGPLPGHDGAFAGHTAESKDVITEEQNGMTPDAEMCPALFLRQNQGGRTLKHAKTAPVAEKEDVRIQEFLDMIAPSVIKFETDYFICGNTYRCVWALREYPTSTEEQAILKRLGEKDGVTLKIYTRHVSAAEERKIISNAASKNRLNQSSTNDLQQTVQAESNLQDVAMIVARTHRNREPLLHTAVYMELTANEYDRLKLLQTEVLTELIRSKLNVDRLLLRQQQGFQCVMPSGRNVFRDQFERVLPLSSQQMNR